MGDPCEIDCHLPFGYTTKCTNPCQDRCKPMKEEGLQNINKSLEATRNHIQEAKTLQQEILRQMKIGEFSKTISKTF